jgi:uncharacterized protein YigA (DUF484 family)
MLPSSFKECVMPYINLTNEQKAQLVGWLNREKDFLLSVKAMAERVMIPASTGTLELIKRDLEFAIRLRGSIRGLEDAIEMSDQDVETLLDVARANTYDNRAVFWKSIIDTLQQQGSQSDSDTAEV